VVASNARLSLPHARLYITLRSAHLERAHALPPAAIVYTTRRYDFDESLTEGLELVQVSPLGAVLLLTRSRLDVVEINEPLMTASLRMTALAVAAIRVRGLLTRHRTTVVSYAIDNRDPWSAPVRPGIRPQVRRWSERLLAGFVHRQIDRIVYGTASAQELYGRVLAPRRPAEVLIPALPVAIEAADGLPDPMLVVFLGVFLPRKGIDRVLAAWPLVRQQVPDARLQILGKGALDSEVLAAAENDQSIDVVLDPPRAEITDVLLRAQVLALPSQPTPTWREQVGLPIVEALAAGCSIVTTTETGLASWLAAHGHSVIPPGTEPVRLAAAIVDQLRAARPAAEVIADLPPVDGRLEADRWMFAPDPTQFARKR
jgi:glycosyltransferase involved in cell wall biosynthesis